MKKSISIFLILIMCGGSDSATTMQDTTSTISTTSTTSTTTTVQDTTITTVPDTTTTTVPEVLNLDYVTVYNSVTSFEEEYSWKNTWVPSEVDDSCIERSMLNQSSVTPGAKRNLEIIFNKDFTSINEEDILNLKILSFSESDFPNSLSFKSSTINDIDSYEGLEYLTCLQYLDLINQKGRDLRFLSSLTNLRYLDLRINDMPRVEVLYTLQNLETLILDNRFKEIEKLVNIPSLRRVAANYSLGCKEEVFSKMKNLEVVLLNGSDIQSYNNLHTREDSFTINKSPSGEYLELIVPEGPNAFMPDYDVLNLAGIHSREYMMNIMQNIYKIVDDQYEVVIFVGNQPESSVGYSGQAAYISNDEPGLGTPIWSGSSCYGSTSELRGHISFPSTSGLHNIASDEIGSYGDGALLHEILHLWGGADIIPYFQAEDGLYGRGHWGYSSGGILGGFNPDSLKEIKDNVYQIGFFGTVGNDLTWNMGNAEMYIMGLLPPENFENIISFVDLVEAEYYASRLYKFKPGKKLTYTLNDITDIYGDVNYINSRNIDALVVYVSEEKVTDTEWLTLNKKLAWYTESSNIDDGFQNIYEASDKLLKLSFPKP